VHFWAWLAKCACLKKYCIFSQRSEQAEISILYFAAGAATDHAYAYFKIATPGRGGELEQQQQQQVQRGDERVHARTMPLKESWAMGIHEECEVKQQVTEAAKAR
jgi:hypothetical protein